MTYRKKASDNSCHQREEAEMKYGKLPVYPNYHNCLVNLSNSILKKFGAETSAETLPLADKYLQKDYQNKQHYSPYAG